MTALNNLLNNLIRDELGFLATGQPWDRSIADELAKTIDITLTDCHWEVIYLVRNFYLNHETHLTNRALVKQVGLQLDTKKGNSSYLLTLFPGAPAKWAAYIAGLPRPPFCF